MLSTNHAFGILFCLLSLVSVKEAITNFQNNGSPGIPCSTSGKDRIELFYTPGDPLSSQYLMTIMNLPPDIVYSDSIIFLFVPCADAWVYYGQVLCSNGQRDCTYDFYEACAVEIDSVNSLGYLNATLYTDCDHITCLQTYFDSNTVSQISQCTTDGTATKLCARNGITTAEISNYYGQSANYPMLMINETPVIIGPNGQVIPDILLCLVCRQILQCSTNIPQSCQQFVFYPQLYCYQ